MLISGGSKGIGAAFAREAVGAGARVSILARGEGDLRATADPIGASWRSVDVTDAAALAEVTAQLEAQNGPVDVLVSCAGIALPGRFLDTPMEEFRQQLDLNYLGTIGLLQAVVPGMAARGAGHVVLTSSTAGLIGVVGYSGYAPTKWAIRGLADTIRYELEPQGVRVGVLYPPDTRTPGFDAENLRKPPETAAISGSSVSPEVVAKALAKGIERNRDNIAVDALTKLLVPLGGVIEPLARGGLRKQIAKAMR